MAGEPIQIEGMSLSLIIMALAFLSVLFTIYWTVFRMTKKKEPFEAVMDAKSKWHFAGKDGVPYHLWAEKIQTDSSKGSLHVTLSDGTELVPVHSDDLHFGPWYELVMGEINIYCRIDKTNREREWDVPEVYLNRARLSEQERQIIRDDERAKLMEETESKDLRPKRFMNTGFSEYDGMPPPRL